MLEQRGVDHSGSAAVDTAAALELGADGAVEQQRRAVASRAARRRCCASIRRYTPPLVPPCRRDSPVRVRAASRRPRSASGARSARSEAGGRPLACRSARRLALRRAGARGLLAAGRRRRAGACAACATPVSVRTSWRRSCSSCAWSGHALTAVRYLNHGWQSLVLHRSARSRDAGRVRVPFRRLAARPAPRGGQPPAERAGWHESHLVTVIGGAPAPRLSRRRRARRPLVCRVLSRSARRRRSASRWSLERRRRAASRRRARAGAAARLARRRDASALLEAFADDYGRGAGARVWRPFLAGWCSWYYVFHDVTRRRRAAQPRRAGGPRGEIPVDVVQLDDGYQRAIGDWLATNAKFPRGLAPLAEAIRAAGFAAGLWTAPFCGAPRQRDLRQAPRLAGLRSGDRPVPRPPAPGRGPADASVHVLDASRPDVHAHLEQVFRALAGMGFPTRSSTSSTRERCSRRRRSRARARARLRAASRRSGRRGEETFLLGCGCPLGAAVGVVDGMRIGPDVAPRWRAEATRSASPRSRRRCPPRGAVRSILARAWMHRRLWLNDPDCLMARATDTRLCPRTKRARLAVASRPPAACCSSPTT